MVSFFTNDVDNIISGTRKTEYLPRWAMDEKIYNCDSTWRVQKGFFLKYIQAFFS